ncbi:pre-mRNA splicing factor protein [Rutstroemia sp. NJR-2017a BVV2]|nr:pre-mRNA splicing factor protein [Rutstroemia sp. NJR-2017a BVV2]PQE18400.1 pre-mRNA splicing factor protein [Rutstroemia sp. NJR-2017a BVV2]
MGDIMGDVESQSAAGAVDAAALDTGKEILDSTHGGTLVDVAMKDTEGEIPSTVGTSLVEDPKNPDAQLAPTNGDKKRKRESKAEREAKRLRKEEKNGPAAERAAKFQEKQRNAQEAREERRRKIEEDLQAKRAEKAKSHEEKLAAIEAAKIEKQREKDAARIAQLEKQVAKDKMLRRKAELARLGSAKGGDGVGLSRREKAKSGPAKSTYFKKTKTGGPEKKKVVEREAGEGQVGEQGVAQQDDAVRETVEVASIKDEADGQDSAEPESAQPEALGPKPADPEVNSPEVDGQSTSQQNPSEQEPAEEATKQPEALAEVVADTPGEAETEAIPIGAQAGTEATPIRAEAEEMDVDIPIEGRESTAADTTENATSAAQSPPVGVEQDAETSTVPEEPSASAKKPTRKRKRNNNRLSTGEETPAKAPNVAEATKASPAHLRTRGAKRAKLSAQANDSSAPEPLAQLGDVNATKTKPVKKPRGKAATVVSKPTVDTPARNTRRAKPGSAGGSEFLDGDGSSFDQSSRLAGEDGGLAIDADNDTTPESPGDQLLAELEVAIHTPVGTSIAADLDQPILRRREETVVNDGMPNPFLDSDGSTDECIVVDVPRLLRSGTKLKRPPAKSPYFTPAPSPSRNIKAKVIKSDTAIADTPPSKKSPLKRPPGTISCIPFPPLSAPHFGLIQEKLAHNPFRLLIAVTFLNRTHGKHAIPVFYNLMEQYPTPESLVDAPKEDIISVIRHLGLQNQRAATYQAYAKIFIENPPIKGKRYAVHDYPTKGQGRDVKRSEVLPDESSDPRPAWEIGHMTQGPYALDSWRIFCRDILRGKAKGWNGEGCEEEGFQPEWMRVLPEDKELRAFLRWMWLKEGFEWDPFTGEKEVAGEELMRAALEGRIAWDDAGGMRILEGLVDPDTGEAAYWSGEGSLVWREDLPV